MRYSSFIPSLILMGLFAARNPTDGDSARQRRRPDRGEASIRTALGLAARD